MIGVFQERRVLLVDVVDKAPDPPLLEARVLLLETFQAARNGSGMIATLNFAANNIGGIFLVFFGMWCVQFVLQGR